MDKSATPIFILAGGLGTRLSEETGVRPKPMVEIGDMPIVVHIMRWYYAHGFNDFVLCAGYKSWEIKNYFMNYAARANHLEVDYRKTSATPPRFMGESHEQEKWRVRVIDTGALTMTGGRVARAFDIVAQTQKIEHFGLTYGDGVCDVDLNKEFAFHQQHGKIGTILGVHPRARFGELDVKNENEVASFLEKPQSRQGYINGGFMFMRGEFRKYLETTEDCILERKPLERLASDNGLRMFKHEGFWQPMDTQHDKTSLEAIWKEGKAPWKPTAGAVK
ncbi:MAG: glucose-1-phosphate cytidylyltransferase [Bdellovibrionales bacterium]|nr:glucose-1-phosphate cytidylyltransferase [Bdellovibrionales bacterium]